MDINVIDDFLPEEEFKKLKDSIVWNNEFPLYFQNSVSASSPDDNCEDNGFWNWYATHILYKGDSYDQNFNNTNVDYKEKFVLSTRFKEIYDVFIPRFKEMGIYTSLCRIKVNMYPYTSEVMEHNSHYDTSIPHKGVLFSLNTCNGFTKLHEGTKIDSVENRLLIFHPHYIHNSSTTSDSSARYNINFNFL